MVPALVFFFSCSHHKSSGMGCCYGWWRSHCKNRWMRNCQCSVLSQTEGCYQQTAQKKFIFVLAKFFNPCLVESTDPRLLIQYFPFCAFVELLAFLICVRLSLITYLTHNFKEVEQTHRVLLSEHHGSHALFSQNKHSLDVKSFESTKKHSDKSSYFSVCYSLIASNSRLHKGENIILLTRNVTRLAGRVLYEFQLSKSETIWWQTSGWVFCPALKQQHSNYKLCENRLIASAVRIFLKCSRILSIVGKASNKKRKIGSHQSLGVLWFCGRLIKQSLCLSFYIWARI